MNSLLRRSAAVVSVSLVFLLVTACRSQSDKAVTSSPSPEILVSSTPPFQTKEPDRYAATRTISTISRGGETVVNQSSMAKDGELRRNEFTAAGKTMVYLETPQGSFVLLTDEKLYADLTNETPSSLGQDDEQSELSPERLLHSDGSNDTSYQTLGTEVIDGRNLKKYRVVVNSSSVANVSQSETFIWIDEALNMPVRSETTSSDGTQITMSLSEIKLDVGRNVFQVPEDYEKVTFAELRKRIMRPD